jgi:phosphoribosylformimino-5-aminoimidazole carboxamide ribotide isomerase
MLIIPVIDLMGGGVVRATAGRRDAYRPIVSPLAASSAPSDIVAGFLRLHPFRVVYVADLDAILGRGDNLSALRGLVDKFPEIAFWLDSGSRSVASESSFETIIGSETMSREAPPPDLSAQTRAILSLDFQSGNFLGPPALATSPRLWPARIIVMTLERVGLGDGPDFATLAAIKARAGGRELFAAGGVRGAEDLAALARRGVAGALMASALHDGRLGPPDFARFAGSTPGG